MQAIQTKYLCPTNFRGSRVKATAGAGSITLEWDDSKNSYDNHRAAMHALVEKLGWARLARDERWETGALSDGSFVHVARS